METRTLLKANLRSKKGTFISIAVLTFLIITIASAILCVRVNLESAVDAATEYSQTGDIGLLIKDSFSDENVLQQIKDLDYISDVKKDETVVNAGTTVIGDGTTGNSLFFMKDPGRYRLYNNDATGFESSIPELSGDEVYIPFGLKTAYGVKVGDKIVTEFVHGKESFTIKGFIQEPATGAQFIGWKLIMVSKEKYDELCSAVLPYNDGEKCYNINYIRIFKSDESLSDYKLQRKLNTDTGIITRSAGLLSHMQQKKYTMLFSDIVTGVILAFVLILFVIVLVVIAHGIKTEIDIDYVNLGILKSQGFTDTTLTRVIMLRYFLSEGTGIVLGLIAGIPLESFFSRLFFSNTAILPGNNYAALRVILLIISMLSLSALIIFIMTRKLVRISPVRAISGGKDDVFFSSRLNASISGRALLPSLAFRCVTSDKKKYAGLLFITALLTFFTVTINTMSGTLDSRKSFENMGESITDIDITIKDRAAFDKLDDIKALIESYSKITKTVASATTYGSLNGVNIQLSIHKYPENITGLLDGKLPEYDNEILVTELVAEQEGLKIGDKVTIGWQRGSDEYIICGLNQSMNDAGLSVTMSEQAAKKLGTKDVLYYGYMLEDASKGSEIEKAVNEKFGGLVECSFWDFNKEMSDHPMIIASKAISVMVYVFSGVFILVVVIMVCSKALTQERTDIGIYKAIGFTSAAIRRQFSIRFLLVSVVGSALGSVISKLFSIKLLNFVFRMFGVSRVSDETNIITYLAAASFICLCVFVFSFITSHRVSGIKPRELITE